MEIILFIAFSLLLFFLINNSINKNREQTGIHKKIKYAFHGLRCYSKGLNYSETEVVRILSERLNTKEYYIFNNLILETSTGSTQIDHVVVSPYGIFVFETKDYSGWIFANERRREWTQTFRTGKKQAFQNPLHQNYRHVKILENYLSFVPSNTFKSIVIFTRNSDFKTKIPRNVIYIDELSHYIEGFSDVLINKAIYFMAIGKLSQLCQSTDISPENHIINLAKEHGKSNDVIN